jgi:L-arginine dehydrogenase
VHVYSPNLKNDSESWARWLPICPNAVLADDANIQSNVLVTSISTNVHRAHKVSPAFLNAAQVYGDYHATTPATAGEMVLAARYHGWTAADARGDLAELSVGTYPTSETGRPVFFRSVGLGLEDIAIINAIYRAARAET